MRPNFRRRRTFKRRGPEHRINQHINAREVRLVGEGIEAGVYSIEKAVQLAREKDLDLIEISPKANPPVCKVLDYNKFLYEKKKKQKQIKQKAVKAVIKEIRFTPNTDDHDFDFKARHAEKFLKEGAKVRAFVQFRGRNIIYKDRGELMLLKLAQKLEHIGVLEQMPKQEGRRMFIFIVPKKKS